MGKKKSLAEELMRGAPPAGESGGVDRNSQFMAATLSLLSEIRNILRVLSYSQPPPPDPRLEQWERWMRLMQARGGVRAGKAGEVVTTPVPAPVQPAAPQGPPPPPLVIDASVPDTIKREFVGEVDVTHMTERAKDRLLEGLGR